MIKIELFLPFLFTKKHLASMLNKSCCWMSLNCCCAIDVDVCLERRPPPYPFLPHTNSTQRPRVVCLQLQCSLWRAASWPKVSSFHSEIYGAGGKKTGKMRFVRRADYEVWLAAFWEWRLLNLRKKTRSWQLKFHGINLNSECTSQSCMIFF